MCTAGESGVGDRVTRNWLLVEQGESRKARAAYGAGLEIAEALAQQDTQNMQRQLDIATFCAKLGSLDCLMATKARRQYLTQGREAIVSLKSQEQLAEYKDWIDLFDAALKHSSWLPWNAARSGLNVIGIGLLAIHILQNPFNVEPGWVAIHLALVISVSLFFGVVFALVDDRPLGTEKTDYQEVNGRILATVKRHPIRLALLIPGEDGIFFVPLLWVGISPFTAGVAAAAIAAFHYPEYPIKACIPKFVFLYGVAMVVLPHGIGSVVVGHLLADAVGFLLLRLLGDD
ncbi:hypothetical protein H6G65_14705 [Microcystis elabens FACHB-917]|nr:hypothetical protein [Microcystis elabens FACHB-917]